MDISITELEDFKVNVKCTLDKEQIQDKKDDIIREFKKAATVPGFRQGKAPIEAISLHFKDQINEALKRELAQVAYNSTVSEHGIKAFGQPQFASMQLDNQKFQCEFCLHKIPDVELAQYKGFDLPRGHLPNAVEMAEKILQELRERHGDTVPFTELDFIQAGDNAIIDYAGYETGKVEPSIKVDGEMFVVGKADLDAFNENLLGMRVGDRREFTVIMPGDTTAQHIANKEVKFAVHLTMASKTVPAPLDDQFAVKLGHKDIAELVATCQSTATTKVKDLEQKNLVKQVGLRLVDADQTIIPSWLALHEAKMLANQYHYNWESLDDEHKSTFIESAKRNVKLSLILSKIRETEPEAQMSEEEIITSIRQNISQYKHNLQGMQGKSDAEVLGLIQQSGFLPALVSHVRDDHTVNFIIENSNIID